MPSFESYKLMLTHGNTAGDGKGCATIGEVLKSNSDMIMEETWDRDLASRKAYLFDYFHDPEPWKMRNIVPDDRYPKPTDVKFIINTYQSMDKDQVAYHLQFRPSEKLSFNDDDEYYYYETDYRDKYDAQYPIGMYIIIPNDCGEYEKWIICAKEKGNQFIKYLILPCNYYFHWVEDNGSERILRKMCGITRSQNSYGYALHKGNLMSKVL